MSEEKSEVKAPEVFVRGGGTPTLKSERLYEQRFQEAEVRRDEAEAEKKKAVQVEAKKDLDRALQHAAQTGQGVQLSNKLTAHADVPQAYIPLYYVNSHGEQIYNSSGEPVVCCSDLIIGMNPDDPKELAIILVCPRCEQQGHKHAQDNQMMIRQSNKKFEFVAAKGAPTFVFQGEVYRSAGMITHSEAFRCYDCGWRARIDHNRVWPD